MNAASPETATRTPASMYPPLLFRQICLLAAMTGMLACRFPGYGLPACALLALLTLSVTEYRTILLFVMSFCLGFFLAFAAAPASPTELAVPEWVRAAVTPGGKNADTSYAQGVALSGIVMENDALAGNRARLLLHDVRRDGRSPDAEAPLPGTLVLTWQNPPPEIVDAGPGQRLAATLRIREIRGFANPGVWETERYWRDRGAYFRAWNRDDGTRNGKAPPYALDGEASRWWRLRAWLRDATLAALTADESQTDSLQAHPLSQAGAVIPALLFGDRSSFTPETLDLVAKSTLAHSLALSGMHLGFMAGIGYGAASLCGFLFPSLFLRLPRQKIGLVCALPLCLCYLWIGGAPPSLVRAGLMLLFWAALLWMNRPKVLIDGLLWAVALIVLLSPATLFDIRLQLSAVSVAGIGLAAPLLNALAQWARPSHGRPGTVCRQVLATLLGMAVISLAAQTAVLPLVLDAFPGTGLWFPLNLVWLPVLGFWVMPLAFAGLLMTALGMPVAASFLFSLAQIPCAELFSLLGAMEAAGLLAAPVAIRPAWPAAAGYWLLLLLLPMVIPARAFTRRTFPLFCLGLALVALPTLAAAFPSPFTAGRDTVRLTLLDVGQGQSVVVSWQSKGERGRMLVDGGGFASPFFDTGRQIVTPALTDNESPRLAWIVNSHPDTDHLEGLLFPMETFMLGQVAFGPEITGKETQATRRRDAILRRRGITPATWRAGDVIALAPDLAVQVLSPDADDTTLPPNGSAPSSNDSALVLRLVWRGKALALICGDLERKGITRLLKRNFPLDADLLILPHHGSAGSFAPKLYDAVSPTLALAACGYANAWNFPSEKVRDALAQRAIPLATTADKGQIRVTWDEAFTMTTEFTRQ